MSRTYSLFLLSFSRYFRHSMPRKSIIEISLSTLVFRPQMKFSWLRDERGHTGDRQKVGGSGTGDHRPPLCRTTLRINRLKGTVADTPEPSIFGPPTFWALSQLSAVYRHSLRFKCRATGAVITASFIPDDAQRPRVLLADDHP